MVDDRDDSVRSAGTDPAHAHATDAGADARPREKREERTMNETGRTGGPPAGDQIPTPIEGVEESDAGSTDDLPNLGDEGGGSRYGDDDAGNDREENEYSGNM
jgi:hypothetical protein